jgi:hypothetical protein
MPTPQVLYLESYAPREKRLSEELSLREVPHVSRVIDQDQGPLIVKTVGEIRDLEDAKDCELFPKEQCREALLATIHDARDFVLENMVPELKNPEQFKVIATDLYTLGYLDLFKLLETFREKINIVCLYCRPEETAVRHLRILLSCKIMSLLGPHVMCSDGEYKMITTADAIEAALKKQSDQVSQLQINPSPTSTPNNPNIWIQ